jgi:hypothetical protein
MNLPAFTIRYWISIGLCVLGFLIPFLTGFYLKLNHPEKMNIVSWILFGINYQWLPFTILLWLLASYVSPFPNNQRVGWIIFIIGILLSFAAYFLLLVASQQSIFYTTRHWISLGLHLLGFAVPFIITVYLKSKYVGKNDIGAIGYQWIPVTATLWLIGAYMWPESRVHLLGWILFGFGMTLSAVWYGLTRIYR